MCFQGGGHRDVSDPLIGGGTAKAELCLCESGYAQLDVDPQELEACVA
jgi:hypothetical protein